MVMKNMIALKSHLLSSLSFDKEIQDVIFLCGDGSRVSANSVFLYLISPYFRTLLPQVVHWTDEDYHLSCPDVSSVELKAMFRDIYKRENVIIVTNSVINLLFDASDHKDDNSCYKTEEDSVIKVESVDTECNVQWEEQFDTTVNELVDEELDEDWSTVNGDGSEIAHNTNCISYTNFSRTLSSKKILEDHVENTRPREEKFKYPCDLCKKKFTKPYIAAKHMKKCQFKKKPKPSSLRTMELRKQRLKRTEIEASKSLPSYDKLYCEVCDKMFTDPYIMFSHVDREHGPFPELSCEHCDKRFSHQSDLNLHIKIDHLKEVKIPCPDCGKLQTTGYMKTHYELVHKICSPITCSSCGKVYNNEFKFKVHLRSHEKKVNDKTGLQNYIERFEKECNCRVELKTKTSKVDHYKLVHLGYEKCLVCTKVVRDVNVNGHTCLQDKEVEESRTFQCPQCGSVFQRASALNYHEKTAHSTQRSECDQCGKIFRSETHMKKHQAETCNLVGTPCTICGKVVKQMAKHLKSAHLSDEQKKRRCEDCGKGFNDESKLKCHIMNVHLKLRPYKCRFGCEMSYNDKSNRTSHERKKHPDLYSIMVQKTNLEKELLLPDTIPSLFTMKLD